MKPEWLFVVLSYAGCAKQPEQEVRASPATLTVHQPFAQHRFVYATGSARPNHKPASSLDQATAAFYETWKERYLEPGCGPGEYRVLDSRDIDSHDVSGSRVTGYGMLITSVMAGHDAKAKHYFDGLLRNFRAHPSVLTQGLMAGSQDQRCQSSEDKESVSEGDLDIAYALLLADKQWGSCRGVDYAAHARWVIDAIASADMHREGRYMLRGDWVAPSDRAIYDTTQPADFIPGHFRGFQEFMNQAWWVQVIDNGYWLLDRVQTTHASGTGLLPELIEAADSDDPRPMGSTPKGTNQHGMFSHSASSVPLRIGTDYLAYGDLRAKRVLERMNTFFEGSTEGDPAHIAEGYELNGEPLRSGESMAFTAPLGVAAMSDRKHQGWLNRLWDRIETADPETRTSDSVRLLSMLVMSGNWWVPDRLPDPCKPR
jgi:endo-1,4-beta-D-glucanase Y